MSNLTNIFYPRKLSAQTLRRKAMREAYLKGKSPKQIADDAGVCLTTVYLNLNIKTLKIKLIERKLEL